MVHGLRQRPSNRRLSEETREKAVRILSQEVYRSFGPALRQLVMQAGLWRGRKQKMEEIHEWRLRRSSRGELIQWDTSEHDWLESRGEKLYLIHRNRRGHLPRDERAPLPPMQIGRASQDGSG